MHTYILEAKNIAWEGDSAKQQILYPIKSPN
jgi:hypothetical protein